MQKPKNTREWLIHITDQINMFRNWKEQEELVNHLLANDVVSVVRCKDCKHYEIHKPSVTLNCERGGRLVPMMPDDYCSYGERRCEE